MFPTNTVPWYARRSAAGRSLPTREEKGAEIARATLTYTHADWEAEIFAVYGMGARPPGCPSCGRRGFYGPRFADPDRQYRACKFCGFWQGVEEESQHYVPVVHGCEAWPEVAGAPYLWWVAPDAKTFDCPYCGKRARVRPSTVAAPAEARDHPWRKLPQTVPQRFYMKFWARWPTTMGRVYM